MIPGSMGTRSYRGRERTPYELPFRAAWGGTALLVEVKYVLKQFVNVKGD